MPTFNVLFINIWQIKTHDLFKFYLSIYFSVSLYIYTYIHTYIYIYRYIYI